MALTRVGGGIFKQPIDVGIITATSVNASGIVTAGTVQIGAATTIHTTGIDLGSGNITSHNINSTGIITATSFVGPVTGNVTGNTSGTASNLTGSPSINVTNITASGNVSIAGTLTYEDVTNIDSVGVVTARSGIHVTGGSVGIGTDNPSDELSVVSSLTTDSVLRLQGGTSAGKGSGIRLMKGASAVGYIGPESWLFGSANTSNTLVISQNAQANLSITSAGNIGVGGLTNPGALLSIPAGESNTPRLAIESAVDDNDFTITQYEDGNGTYTMLGQNVKLNVSGNTTVLDSGHKTAGILLDARSNGNISFYTGGDNASTEKLRITSGGDIGIGIDPSFPIYTGTNDRTLILGTGSEDSAIQIHSGTSNYGGIYFGDATSGSNRYRGYIEFKHGTSDDFLRFGTGANERLRILSTGQIGMGKAGAVTVNGNSPLTIQESDSNSETICLRATNSGGNGSQPGIVMKTAAGGHIGGIYCDVNSDYMRLSTSGTDRVYISDTGNVGINKNAPADRLHVGGKIRFGNNNTYYGVIEHEEGVTGANIYTSQDSGGHIFKRNSTTQMTIDAAGDVGVGTDNPAYDLDVWGDVNPSSSANGGGTTGNIRVVDTSAIAADTGGVISFSYLWSDPPAHLGNPPYIKAVKTNSASGNYGGGLAFGTRVGGGNQLERMRISEEGYVTKPNQPAFCVYRNQSQWVLSSGDTFVFNTAEFNVGSHYNTSNGRFTAPIFGTYVFHFYSIYLNSASNDYIQMYKNNARIQVGDTHFTSSIGSQWDNITYSRVIQLNVNDYVHMRAATGHTFHGNNWGGWCGYMLG